MLVKSGSALALALLFSAAGLSADFDWNNRSDRENIDRWMQKLSEQCSQLGFDRVTASGNIDMQKRIYAHLLLLQPFQAQVEVDRWASYILTMKDLGSEEKIAETGDRAGAALTAALVDSSYMNEARKKYVEAVVSSMRPFHNACRDAAADPFLQTHYLTGSGALTSFEAKAAQAFDESVRDGVGKQ